MERNGEREVLKLTASSNDTDVMDVNPPASMNPSEETPIMENPSIFESANEKENEEANHTSFTFVLKGWRELDDKKVISDWHEYEGYRWRILVFPKGNRVVDYLSVYVECSDLPPASQKTASPGAHASAQNATDACSDDLARMPPTMDPTRNRQISSSPLYPSWRCPASFKLILRHPSSSLQKPDGKEGLGFLNIVKDTHHIFSERESDWGFREFVKIEQILHEGFVNEEDGSICLEAVIVVEEKANDPYYNLANWDSRKKTGYVGLKNQGATCYMNSLLQTLFMLGEFRRAVFNMPLPEENSENSSSEPSYALQKLFYELQFSPTVVKTKKLTESFGWDTTDAFTQHDVQELNRILCDHLEEKMKKLKPPRPNTIAQLFEGKLLNYIECVDVDFKSMREESFYDLSLNVKGCQNIYDSFDKYTEVEMMEGDNKYRAEGYRELQKAKKGVRFAKLPPVLQLHLKRFEYDFTRAAEVKINDRFEFPKELNLCKYVGKSDGNDIYLLHSVLVHIGDVNGGHYYAFIRPDIETHTGDPGTWYKFDDELVNKVTEEDAIQNNFGAGGERDIKHNGEDDLSLNGTNNGLYNGVQTHQNPVFQPRLRSYFQTRRFSNAYMLQYIRKNAVAKLLRKPTDEDIPKELKMRITREKEEEERRRKERAEQHLYTYFNVATDEDLAAYHSHDLVSFSKVKQLRVKRTTTLMELKILMQKARLVRDPRRVRIWRCVKRKNETLRPDELLADGVNDRPVAEALKDEYLNFYTPSYCTPSYTSPMTRLQPGQLMVGENIYVEDFCSKYAIGSRGKEASEAFPEIEEESRGNINSDLESVDEAPQKDSAEETSIQGEDVISGALESPLGLVDDEVLLFFKFYTPKPRPELHFVGHTILSKNTRISEMTPILVEMLQRWSERTGKRTEIESSPEFRLWEEVRVSMVEELHPSSALFECGIPVEESCGGDIIVFQKINSGDHMHCAPITTELEIIQGTTKSPDLPLGGRELPLATHYYTYLGENMKIECKDKHDPAKGGIVLEVLRRDSYRLIRRLLANALGGTADPDRIRFFGHDVHRDGPRAEAVHLRDKDQIGQMFATYFKITTPTDEQRILWYEHTEYNIREFLGKEEVRITWRPDCGTPGIMLNCKERTPRPSSIDSDVEMGHANETQNSKPSTEPKDASGCALNGKGHSVNNSRPESCLPRTFSVLVPKFSKYGDVLHQVRLKMKAGAHCPLRLLQVKSSRITQILDPDEVTKKQGELALEYGVELRAEPTPPDQTLDSLGEDAILVPIAHVTKDKPRVRRGASYFGVPFLLRVPLSGDNVGNLRERIRVLLSVDKEEFASWRLGEIKHSKIIFFEEMDKVWAPSNQTTRLEWNSLALEHKSNEPVKKAALYSRFADKPLKIRS